MKLMEAINPWLNFRKKYNYRTALSVASHATRALLKTMASWFRTLNTLRYVTNVTTYECVIKTGLFQAPYHLYR